MLIGKPAEIPSSQITPQERYLNRRRFFGAAGAATLGHLLAPRLGALGVDKLPTVKSPLSTVGEQLTSYNDITHYNNYYEFGVDKGEPSRNAGRLVSHPWTVRVEGLVNKPLVFDIDTLRKLRPLEERIYRHRCVEAWSMVIPWVGYSLSALIQKCEPLSSAKYVQFLSYYDKRIQPWAEQQTSIHWPYSEGLRMDEAMHPLTLLAFGLYGEPLTNQNGAPVRTVIPWKYGYKSAKAIATIRFTDAAPPTTWNLQDPSEYGFYSNVNPQVDHPRWSQKSERRIGLPFYAQRKTTLLFNGYGDQVAGLYAGMDLRKNF